MGWFSDRRRREDPRLAEQVVAAKVKQETKLAEWEDFKPADVATTKGELVPVNSPAPAAKATPAVAPATATKTSLATAVKETFKPAPIAMQPAPVPRVAPVSRPQTTKAPAPAAQVAPIQTSRLSPAELQLLKDQEADLGADVKKAQRAYRTQVQSDEKSDEAQLAAHYRAYAKMQNGRINEMISLATEREDARAAASHRALARDIQREEALRPPKPAGKPTFEQYVANPSRYGKAPGVKSGYHPTKKDLDKQPFQAERAVCTGYGYKASENCVNCRRMGLASGQHIHCPCGCGSYVPIDRHYDPFAGNGGPSFDGKSSGRLFR
jgi:hypothetical protein